MMVGKCTVQHIAQKSSKVSFSTHLIMVLLILVYLQHYCALLKVHYVVLENKPRKVRSTILIRL